MISRLFFALFLFINYFIYGQINVNRDFEFKYKPPEKYRGLDFEEIGKVTFYEKAKKDFIHYAFYELNDTIFYNLQWSYFFGKLEPSRKNLLFNYMAREHEIDTSKIIVIHYVDSLKSINRFPKNDSVINSPNGGHRHLSSHANFVRVNRDCIKKYEKNKHSNVYHFFRKNKDHPLEIDGAKWYYDKRSSLYSIFNRTIKTFHTVIINQDGKYFVYNYPDSNKSKTIYEKLIKAKRWDKYYKEFMESKI